MMKQEQIIAEVTYRMMGVNHGDSRRIEHTMKVYGYARTIGVHEKLPNEQLFILELAALLHDIGIQESERKYGSPAGKYQEIEGPPIAQEILSSLKVEDSVIARVCFLIGNHHTYTANDGMDFQVLIESDFLVNAVEDAYTEEQVKTAARKIFQTNAGKNILDSLVPGTFNR